MYELVQVGRNSYYMDCPAKVGIYRVSERDAVLFDSGSDKDAAKKVRRILESQGWTLKAIYNTHSHADHIGGNRYLQELTGCKIYACGIESCFVEFPVLEPTALYGGFPPDELRNRFLMAKESRVERLNTDVLPEGVEILPLPGHCFDMVGFRTPDDVVFLADCLSSEEILQKYGLVYLHDVGAYLETLERVKNLKAKCFVPSHAAPVSDIVPLAQLNIEKTKEISAVILSLLSSPKAFDELLAHIFNSFGLAMTIQQHALIGSTLRSYLSYLKRTGKIDFLFDDNRMLWQTI